LGERFKLFIPCQIKEWVAIQIGIGQFYLKRLTVDFDRCPARDLTQQTTDGCRMRIRLPAFILHLRYGQVRVIGVSGRWKYR